MPAIEEEVALPPMLPWALHQMGMLLLLARNAQGGHWPLTTTPEALTANLANDRATATVRRVLDDFDWRRAIERDNGVRLAWDGTTLVVDAGTEGVGA